MSSVLPVIAEGSCSVHSGMESDGFTRLERMLLFAVVSECERCISSEGMDCMNPKRVVSCPFVSVREDFDIVDIFDWKERVR